MSGLSASELAKRLNVSRGRVSQYVAEGVLSGCFVGEGRARRFNEKKVRERLQHRLDPGQMLGNGKATRQKGAGQEADKTPIKLDLVSENTRYEQARTIKAEEEARKLRRTNEEAEGRYVLAEEASRNIQSVLRTEIDMFEVFLKEMARLIADSHGLDAKALRKQILDVFRERRKKRSSEIKAQAQSATMTPDETEKDI